MKTFARLDLIELDVTERHWGRWESLRRPIAFTWHIDRSTAHILDDLRAFAGRKRHLLLVYEHEVVVEDHAPRTAFLIKTLRRYGSSQTGGYPVTSALGQGWVEPEGRVWGEVKFGAVALVRALGITLIASAVLLFSVLSIQWTMGNAIFITLWLSLVTGIPAYLWLELWWDHHTTLNDLRRAVQG